MDLLIEFLKAAIEFPLEMLAEEDMFLKFFGGIILLFELLLAVGIVWFILRAINSWFLPIQETFSRVVRRSETTGHFIPLVSNNVTTLMWIPATHSIHFTINAEEHSFEVSEDFWNEVQVSDELVIGYVNGRFVPNTYPRTVAIR